MGLMDSVSNIKDKIKNPFSASVEIPFTENDFPEGFLVKEILNINGKWDEENGKSVVLTGNMMPEIPFITGGSQRTKKDFYAGSNEPVVHVLGAEDDDVTIKGKFKAKRYESQEYREVPKMLQEEFELMRERGNLILIELGEYRRYCFIYKTKFNMNLIPDIGYEITFMIVGRNKPENAGFLHEARELPNNVNSELIAKASEWNSEHSNIPDSVPQSIGDKLNSLTSSVASAVNTVTGFVDTVISTYNDVQKSITRAKGLITHAQQKLRSYRDFVGSIDPFNSTQALSGKYSNAKYYNSRVSASNEMISMLEKLRSQLSKLTPTLPIGRHVVKSGETLQKISIKYYGNQDSWKKIYDYNKLTSTDLASGSILEIPRV